MVKIITEAAKELFGNPWVMLFGTITLFEIAPIKINPWRWIGKVIGNLVLGEIRAELREFKRDFEETKAQDKRWHILNFANSCRDGKRHSKDEWRHVISEISEYERYTEEKDIANGVFEEDSKYLRELYRKRNEKNDFFIGGESYDGRYDE